MNFTSTKISTSWPLRNTFAIQFTRYYFIVATINALITLFVWRILDFGYIIGTATTAPFDGLMWITGWFVNGPREGSIFPIDSVLVIVLLVIPSIAAWKFNATKDDRTTSSSSDSVETRHSVDSYRVDYDWGVHYAPGSELRYCVIQRPVKPS